MPILRLALRSKSMLGPNGRPVDAGDRRRRSPNPRRKLTFCCRLIAACVSAK